MTLPTIEELNESDGFLKLFSTTILQLFSTTILRDGYENLLITRHAQLREALQRIAELESELRFETDRAESNAIIMLKGCDRIEELEAEVAAGISSAAARIAELETGCEASNDQCRKLAEENEWLAQQIVDLKSGNNAAF